MTKRLLFAGGGTGGHVFPMIAVADAVRVVAPDAEIRFVGTARGIETRAVPERGYPLDLVDVVPIRGGGLAGAIRGVVRAARSIPEARVLLGRIEPDVVFSAGGYAAGPVTVAARTLGVPVALMEPNSAIGLSNKLAAPFVQRAYTAFPESERHFSPGTVLQTGVPIRSGFVPTPLGERGARLSVLVVGGSQGAVSLNEVVPRALARAAADVQVMHQAGRGHDAVVRELYRSLGAEGWATVVPFIDDVPVALASADLVIGRAGASAVAEFCAVGRPSLLIPYPFAGDHQRHNAASLEERGAAVCMLSAEATEERIAAEVDRLANDFSGLRAMADRARALGRPEAAAAIARDLLALAGASTDGAADADVALARGRVGSGRAGAEGREPPSVGGGH